MFTPLESYYFLKVKAQWLGPFTCLFHSGSEMMLSCIFHRLPACHSFTVRNHKPVTISARKSYFLLTVRGYFSSFVNSEIPRQRPRCEWNLHWLLTWRAVSSPCLMHVLFMGSPSILYRDILFYTDSGKSSLGHKLT